MPTRATPTPAGSGTIDFAKCFTFAVEDPDWVKKILFGGLFTLQLSTVANSMPFMLMLLVLLIRPAGLMGDRQ